MKQSEKTKVRKHVTWKPSITAKELQKAVEEVNLEILLGCLNGNIEAPERYKLYILKNLCPIFKLLNAKAKTDGYDQASFQKIILLLKHMDSSQVLKSYGGFAYSLARLKKAGEDSTNYLEQDQDFIFQLPASSDDQENDCAPNSISKTSNLRAESDSISSHATESFKDHSASRSEESKNSEPNNIIISTETKTESKEHKYTSATSDNFFPLNHILNSFYAWLDNLPTELQKYILNTAPVKSFIENTQLLASIYNSRPVEELFNKTTTISFSNTEDLYEYSETPLRQEFSYSEHIDMDMINEQSYVNGLIFPMQSIDPTNILAGNLEFIPLVF